MRRFFWFKNLFCLFCQRFNSKLEFQHKMIIGIIFMEICNLLKFFFTPNSLLGLNYRIRTRYLFSNVEVLNAAQLLITYTFAPKAVRSPVKPF